MVVKKFPTFMECNCQPWLKPHETSYILLTEERMMSLVPRCLETWAKVATDIKWSWMALKTINVLS
jgi:hypothetical protein